MSSQTAESVTVSVLMPTYRQDAFITRALESLFAQTFEDFEVVIVNDGSDDSTDEIVKSYDDPRIRYVRLPHNTGLGAALNRATAMARGEFLAYLPSDDVYASNHLATCVEKLRGHPEAYLAYAGVRWVRRVWDIAVHPPQPSPTLRGDIAPGSEHRILAPASPGGMTRMDVRSGNFLALVQVMHRRADEATVRWQERSEAVSDSLEVDFWRGLLRAGATFAYTGDITCEWGDHPEQRHKIISGRGIRSANQLSHGYGLSRYRQHYQVPAGQRLVWQPVVEGMPIDERRRYDAMSSTPRPGTGSRKLKILLVGALSFNPERILALEEDGHTLSGLWDATPHFWENTGPLPYGNIGHIPYDDRWQERVREFDPDVIYGMLNWQAIPLLHEVYRAGLASPFVLHFKESPLAAMQVGTWPKLREMVLGSAGRIFISEEAREWFELTLGRTMRDGSTLVLDGDLPKADWSSADWSGPLSDDAPDPEEVHTVCAGRIFLEPMLELAKRKIHVHHYGSSYSRWSSRWVSAAKGSSWLHLHGDVEPQDWVRELSRYDAGWLHVFSSANHGDLRMASWDDINVPARLSTYAVAGLPWIYKRNPGNRFAVDGLAQRFGVGVAYDDIDHLAKLLRHEKKTRAARANMHSHRDQFLFDTHVPRLIGFFENLKAS